MKCVSCEIEVSPNFVAAISDNRCPACGGQLMDGSEYKKLFALKKQLVPLDLGIESDTLVKISAAILSKFDLWPRDITASTSVEEGDDSLEEAPQIEEPIAPTSIGTAPKKMKPIQPKSQQDAEQIIRSRMPQASFDDAEEAYYEDDISPEEEAKLIREFGLDKGDIATAMTIRDENPNGFIDPELMSIMGEYDFSESEESNSLSQDRMSRARALGMTTNKFGIKPLKTHSR